MPSKRLKIKLPKKPKRKLLPRRNDDSNYLIFKNVNMKRMISLNNCRSEFELVGSSSVGNGESSSEISAEVGNGLDVLDQSGVNCLLSGF